MSIEHDQSTRKAMRAGISGENVLRPLDEFSVTVTKPVQVSEAWERYMKNQNDICRQLGKLAL